MQSLNTDRPSNIAESFGAVQSKAKKNVLAYKKHRQLGGVFTISMTAAEYGIGMYVTCDGDLQKSSSRLRGLGPSLRFGACLSAAGD